MSHRITLIPGDGIGPEVTDAVLRILGASGVDIEWERHDAGVPAIERHGVTLPKGLLDSIIRNRVALKGPVTTPVGCGFRSVNVALRKKLDLYAGVRPQRIRHAGAELVGLDQHRVNFMRAPNSFLRVTGCALQQDHHPTPCARPGNRYGLNP